MHEAALAFLSMSFAEQLTITAAVLAFFALAAAVVWALDRCKESKK